MDKQSAAFAMPASARGAGAIHLLWIWGPRARDIVRSLFASEEKIFPPENRIHLGAIRIAGETIDEAMCRKLAAGETVLSQSGFEISLHGSPAILNRVLQACEQHGATVLDSESFLDHLRTHATLDRCREEAWRALFGARTDAGAKLFLAQAEGALSREIERLLRLAEQNGSETACANALDALLARASSGIALAVARRVVLCGAPNAGKSTLFNALVGYERAIVSPIAGTTRDRVEEIAILGGYPFSLVDTAGLRASGDAIEQEGTALAVEEARRADLTLFLWDATKPWGEREEAAAARLPLETRILVHSKVRSSQETVAELERVFCDRWELLRPPPTQGACLFTTRQRDLAIRARGQVVNPAVFSSTLRQILG